MVHCACELVESEQPQKTRPFRGIVALIEGAEGSRMVALASNKSANKDAKASQQI